MLTGYLLFLIPLDQKELIMLDPDHQSSTDSYELRGKLKKGGEGRGLVLKLMLQTMSCRHLHSLTICSMGVILVNVTGGIRPGNNTCAYFISSIC